MDNECPHFEVILEGRVYYDDHMAERYYCNCCGASWEGEPFYPEPKIIIDGSVN